MFSILVFLVFFQVLSRRVNSLVPVTPDNVCKPNPPNPLQTEAAVPHNCEKHVNEAFKRKHPDQHKNTRQVLELYGYGCEVHHVVSKDGYVITLHRITGVPDGQEITGGKKPPVLMQHGLFSASDNWLFQPMDRNLAMKLANAGYDVWLSDSRGNTYSRGHVKLNADVDLNYWNFSWHEMGVYDVPAMVDHILTKTQTSKIFYVGHSMGSTMMFVALSEIPELNDKLLACFMFAPVAFLGHMNSPGRVSYPIINTDKAYRVTNRAFQGVVQPNQDFNKVSDVTVGDICTVTVAQCGLCPYFVFLAFGFNPSQLNLFDIPNIVDKFPNSASLKSLAHYSQISTDCRFRMYDYAIFGNLIHYRRPTPPDYKLNTIRAPMHFFYTDNDNLAPPNDIHITASKFTHGVIRSVDRIDDDLFTHIDFLTAKDADKLLYNNVLNRMEGYVPNETE